MKQIRWWKKILENNKSKFKKKTNFRLSKDQINNKISPITNFSLDNKFKKKEIFIYQKYYSQKGRKALKFNWTNEETEN